MSGEIVKCEQCLGCGTVDDAWSSRVREDSDVQAYRRRQDGDILVLCYDCVCIPGQCSYDLTVVGCDHRWIDITCLGDVRKHYWCSWCGMERE